jgi:hypothetical protein
LLSFVPPKPAAFGEKHSLQILELSKELSCFRCVMTVALQSRNKLTLPRNVALSDTNVLFGIVHIPL